LQRSVSESRRYEIAREKVSDSMPVDEEVEITIFSLAQDGLTCYSPPSLPGPAGKLKTTMGTHSSPARDCHAMRILGIESSCDDTAAAVVEVTDNRPVVLASIVSSQDQVHAPFGGIVPELASRRHIEAISPVVRGALAETGMQLDDLDGIAATRGPGLVGSLLVGYTFAKALALARNLPCVGVDHMRGHLLSVFLGDNPPEFPYLALVVSGGNTSLYEVRGAEDAALVGRSRDDAAGEAFDKAAKLLELGYPGGPAVSRLAEEGDPNAYALPRPMLGDDSLDFSFSGIKTAVAVLVQELARRGKRPDIPGLCASFQQAVVEVLVGKTLRASIRLGLPRVVLGGGVAANRVLRQTMAAACAGAGLSLHVPPPAYCTDNAAMIAYAGWHLLRRGRRDDPDSDVYSRSPQE